MPKTNNAHWEKPQSVTGARDYALAKGEPILEEGHLEICRRNADDWRGFVNACKEQDPKELIDGPFSKLYATFRGFASEVHNQFAKQTVMDGELEHEWIYGDPGTGKTRGVWEKYPDLYVKNINKWWDGYNDQDVVLLDDWDPTHKVLA